MAVNPDFRDLFSAFNAANVRYDGVAFEAAWPNRVESAYGDQRIWVIGRTELIANKRAAGRTQDPLDLALLERHS